MYRTYASNLPLAHGLINRLASSSPEFSTFLDVRCSPRPTATLRGRPLLTLQRFRGHPCPVARHQPTLWLPDAPAAAGLADQPHRPLRPALSRCAWLLENAVLGAYSDWRALCWARAVSDPVPSPALPLRSAAISTDGRQCPPPPPTHPPAKTPPPLPPSPLNPTHPPTRPPPPPTADLEARTPVDHPARALVSSANRRIQHLHAAIAEIMGTADNESPGSTSSGPPTTAAIAMTILKCPVRAHGSRRLCASRPLTLCSAVFHTRACAAPTGDADECGPEVHWRARGDRVEREDAPRQPAGAAGPLPRHAAHRQSPALAAGEGRHHGRLHL